MLTALTDTRGSFRSAFRHGDYRRLLAGLTISQAGDWLYNVALVVFVYEETHSAGWVAVSTILRLTPYVLLGPFGGEIVDRFERRRLMVVSDVLRGSLMLLLAIVAASHGPVLLAGLIAFATTAFGTAYNPAVAAMTPLIVGEEDLAAANSLESSIQNVALIVGPAIGAGLLALGTPALAFVINAVSFFGAGIAVATIKATSRAEARDDEAPRVLRRVAAGFQTVGSSAAAFILVSFVAVTSFTYGTDTVLFVLVSKDLLGTGVDGYGYLIAALGAGGLLATMLTNRLASAPRLSTILFAGLAAYCLPTALLVVVHEPAAAFVIQAFRGGGSIVVDVLAITALQRSLSQDIMGRVFGVLYSIAVGSILLGSFAAPWAVKGLGLNGSLLLFAFLFPVLILWLMPRLRAVDRESEERVAELEPRVELLVRLRPFNEAPRQVLEALAAAAIEEDVPAGTVIIKQGDPAGDFYAIRRGSVDVVVHRGKSKERIATLQAGDYFGEIGLLQQVPRTADVVAREDSSFYRIAGDDFLDAVNDSPGSSPALLEGVTRRLARSRRRPRAPAKSR